jgi:L-cystine uptake protein TcyP (sodium:dicarboxylate symporter family)
MINKFSNRVHVKTEIQGDKQHYYKIIGIGMDQFGVHMNFLGFKQVSAIIYILKINFPNYSFIFTSPCTAHGI